MNTRIVPIKVLNEYVKGAGVVVGSAGSHNDVMLEITFSGLWDGLAKSITWLDAKGENPTITLLTTNLLAHGKTDVYLVPIPAEPKVFEGDMSMTIKGAMVEGEIEKRATLSTTATFRILPSAFDSNAQESGDITPTQAEQMQSQLDAILETIVDAREAAKEAAERAASAKVSADSASSSASSASASDDSAQTHASRAISSAALSKSWAAGGTGVRENEDTNNAKFWAERAQSVVNGNAFANTKDLDKHINDKIVHVTEKEREFWNSKQPYGDYAPKEHKHNANDINAGLVPITYGGTGSNNPMDALVALGASPINHTHKELVALEPFQKYYWRRRRLLYSQEIHSATDPGTEYYKLEREVVDADGVRSHWLPFYDTTVRVYSVSIQYSDSISLDPITGEISLINPSVYATTFQNGDAFNTLKGKYFKGYIKPNGTIDYDTVFYVDDVEYNWWFLRGINPIIGDEDSYMWGFCKFDNKDVVPPLSVITSVRGQAFGEWETVSSDDEDAYPKDGNQGDYEYEYIQYLSLVSLTEYWWKRRTVVPRIIEHRHLAMDIDSDGNYNSTYTRYTNTTVSGGYTTYHLCFYYDHIDSYWSGSCSVAYSDSIEYDPESRKYILVNPSHTEVAKANTNLQNFYNTIRGKYICGYVRHGGGNDNETIFYVEDVPFNSSWFRSTTVTFTDTSGQPSEHLWWGFERTVSPGVTTSMPPLHIVQPIISAERGTAWEMISSSSASTYPHSGVSGGYEYLFLSNVFNESLVNSYNSPVVYDITAAHYCTEYFEISIPYERCLLVRGAGTSYFNMVTMINGNEIIGGNGSSDMWDGNAVFDNYVLKFGKNADDRIDINWTGNFVIIPI